MKSLALIFVHVNMVCMRRSVVGLCTSENGLLRHEDSL